MNADAVGVEQWGMRTFVAEQLREESAIPIDRLLIAEAAHSAKQGGYDHLPGEETVEFVERDDPRWVTESARPPEGSCEARVTIRVTPSHGRPAK